MLGYLEGLIGLLRTDRPGQAAAVDPPRVSINPGDPSAPPSSNIDLQGSSQGQAPALGPDQSTLSCQESSSESATNGSASARRWADPRIGVPLRRADGPGIRADRQAPPLDRPGWLAEDDFQRRSQLPEPDAGVSGPASRSRPGTRESSTAATAGWICPASCGGLANWPTTWWCWPNRLRRRPCPWPITLMALDIRQVRPRRVGAARIRSPDGSRRQLRPGGTVEFLNQSLHAAGRHPAPSGTSPAKLD